MKFRKEYSGDILQDILDINEITYAEFRRLNYSSLKYKPSNLASFANFVSSHDDVVFVCDSDADGLSSAGVVRAYNSDAIIITGDRSGERGLSISIVDEILEKYRTNRLGIITLDCGISNLEGIEYAQKCGIDVFVTDHHLPGNVLPPCEFINPHLDSKADFKDLCGSGVIYATLYHLFGENVDALQYAAIGTIADVVSLLGDNRYIVKAGLRAYKNDPAITIKNFLDSTKLQFNSEIDVGWYIGPTINAASRFNQTDVAYQLYVNGNIDYAPQLVELNKQRKKLTKQSMDTASYVVTDNIVFAEIEHTDAAIAGIVAMKMATKYNRVACVYTGYTGDEKYHASIRTLDIIDANDFIQSSLYAEGGGHAAAAGFVFSKEKKNDLLGELDGYVAQHGKSIEDLRQADIAIELNESVGLYKEIRKLAPFGAGFRMPTFCSSVNIQPMDLSYTVSGHIKFDIDGITGYYYNPPEDINLPFGNVDIQYEVDYNTWNRTVYIKIIGIE